MTCPAQTGPVWNTGGEVHGCVFDAGHETKTAHECDCGAWWVDSIRRDSGRVEPDGPSH